MDVIEQDRDRLDALTRTRLERNPSAITRIPAGLGTRRFYRLAFETGAPPSLIARLEDDGAVPPAIDPEPPPPPWLPEPPLEPLRGFLERAGLPVPRSALHVPADANGAGIDLLEDVGDRTLLDVDAETRAARTLEACAWVPRWQTLRAEPDEIPAFGRRYDARLVATKAWKWLNWTIPLLLGRPATPEETEHTHALFDRIIQLAEAAPARLAHRDFKAENLHLVPADDAAGTPERLVMIDVQGAFLAPPEYDLACLLHDLQTDHAPDFVEAALLETRPALPDAPDLETFQTRFDALSLARLCKDVSHVVHASLRRNDRRRWAEIPRGLALIERLATRQSAAFPGAESLLSVTHALGRAL